MAFTHALSTNNYGPARLIIATSVLSGGSGIQNGTHSTLTSAMADAVSGDTIFLRDSVTENVTLKPGVNISAWTGGSLNTPTINGTLSMTAAGTCNIGGIRLASNGASFLSVTGSAASIVNLNNCYLTTAFDPGITFSSSDSGARININYCFGDITASSTRFFNHSSSGILNLFKCKLSNSILSQTASTCSAGTLLIDFSIILFPITISASGLLVAEYSNFNTSTLNTTGVTALTLGGGANSIINSSVGSGAASAISISSSLAITNSVIATSNTNAITGGGTLSYTNLSFNLTTSNINVTTQTLLMMGPSLLISSTNSGNTNTLTTGNTSNTASSRANIVSSVAGSSAGDATHQAVVSGVTTWTWGIDNSVTSPTADPFVISQGTTLGTNNIMSVATSGEINYPLQPSFLATASAQADVTGDGTAYTVLFANEIYDQNSDFSSPTFTAPVTGRYLFCCTLSLAQLGAANTSGFSNFIGSNRTLSLFSLNVGAARDSINNLLLSSSSFLDMDAADTCHIQVQINAGTKIVDIAATSTTFSGQLMA